jgi:RNA polymerase sigma-70 factor, ECF subfamily
MRSDIEQAILLLKRGDAGAMDKAVALLQRSVFAFSMRVCGQQQDAEDTMQEVLVRSLPYLAKFDSSKALAVWLYKAAKNRCLMNRRRSKFAPKLELSLEELMPDREDFERLDGRISLSPEGAAIRGEESQRLRQAIQRVPPHYRIVIVLHDMEGLTEEEVSEITGLRTGTIRVRLHRARLFVRKELAKLSQGTKGSVVRGHVKAPDRSRRCMKMFAGLSDYLDGQLDSFSCEEIESHLNSCQPCKKVLRSLKTAIKRCKQSPMERTDPNQAAALRKQLLATYSRALANAGK